MRFNLQRIRLNGETMRKIQIEIQATETYCMDDPESPICEWYDPNDYCTLFGKDLKVYIRCQQCLDAEVQDAKD